MSDITQCRFPLCKRHAVKDGLCIGHRIYAGEKITNPTPTKKATAPKKPIAKKSAKRIKDDAEYKRIVKELHAKSDRCEINSPVCTGKSQGLHHMKKRSPSTLKDPTNLKRSCNRCNLYMEEHPDWAAEKGFSISKYK